MPAPDTPHRFPLPPRVLKLIGIAVAGGLLLFLLVWWDQRNDTDFFTARQATPDGGEPDGLPVPLPADVATGDDTASGLRGRGFRARFGLRMGGERARPHNRRKE